MVPHPVGIAFLDSDEFVTILAFFGLATAFEVVGDVMAVVDEGLGVHVIEFAEVGKLVHFGFPEEEEGFVFEADAELEAGVIISVIDPVVAVVTGVGFGSEVEVPDFIGDIGGAPRHGKGCAPVFGADGVVAHFEEAFK